MISVRIKIVLIIISCTLIFGGIISYFSIKKTTELLEKQASALISSNTNSLINKINSENNKIESTISTVASLMVNNFQLELAMSNEDYIKEKEAYLSDINAELLERSHKSGGGAMSIYATFNVEIFKKVFETWHTVQNNIVTLMNDEPLELFDDQNNPDMAWYFDPIKERRGIWTETYEDALTKIPMYSFVEPAINDEGNIIGIVGMDISLQGISEFVSEQKTIKNGFSFLIDRNNQFIVSPKETISKPLLEQLFKLKEENIEGIINDEQAIVAYGVLPNKQVVATYVRRSDIYSDIYQLRIKLVLFMLGMIVLSAVLGFVLIAPIILRINKLKEAMKMDGSEKKISSLFENYYNDEIGQLANAFSKMFQKIKKSQMELEDSNRNLENRVRERTLELEQKIKEMEKFSEITVNRELRMIELKDKLKKLSDEQKL